MAASRPPFRRARRPRLRSRRWPAFRLELALPGGVESRATRIARGFQSWTQLMLDAARYKQATLTSPERRELGELAVVAEAEEKAVESRQAELRCALALLSKIMGRNTSLQSQAALLWWQSDARSQKARRIHVVAHAMALWTHKAMGMAFRKLRAEAQHP